MAHGIMNIGKMEVVMSDLSRRDFLKLGSGLAVMMGLSNTMVAKIADGLESLVSTQAPVIWIQGLSCSGCSVSTMNTTSPGPVELLTDYLSLLCHSTLSTATGDMFTHILEKSSDGKDFILVVEGSVPAQMPEACTLHGKPMESYIIQAAKNASVVITVGNCACFGGVPAAEGNPTGAESVPDCLIRNNVTTPVVRVPGCSVHPEWLVGTMVHVLKFGIPELDAKQCPTMFYGKLNHDNCPRYSDYESERFAKHFSDKGCLYKLGCMGVRTYSDCALRLWNSGTNYCISAGAPCIGCTSEFFAKYKKFPLYRLNERGA